MRTPAGVECGNYYEDFYRGRSVQECRLIERNPSSKQWEPKLCARCPVPGIVRANVELVRLDVCHSDQRSHRCVVGQSVCTTSADTSIHTCVHDSLPTER